MDDGMSLVLEHGHSSRHLPRHTLKGNDGKVIDTKELGKQM